MRHPDIAAGWGKAKIPFTSQCIRTSSGKKRRGKNSSSREALC